MTSDTRAASTVDELLAAARRSVQATHPSPVTVWRAKLTASAVSFDIVAALQRQCTEGIARLARMLEASSEPQNVTARTELAIAIVERQAILSTFERYEGVRRVAPDRLAVAMRPAAAPEPGAGDKTHLQGHAAVLARLDGVAVPPHLRGILEVSLVATGTLADTDALSVTIRRDDVRFDTVVYVAPAEVTSVGVAVYETLRVDGMRPKEAADAAHRLI